MPQESTIEMIKFPVICFQKDFFRVRFDRESLITSTKAGLKNEYFSNLLIVDSSSKGYVVKSAKKLHGIGPFFGYNIFLNQKIKVELEFEGCPQNVSLEEVKKLVFQSFKKWHGWSTRGNLEELKERVENAESISEIIQFLS